MGKVGPHADVDIDGGHIQFEKSPILCIIIILKVDGEEEAGEEGGGSA